MRYSPRWWMLTDVLLPVNGISGPQPDLLRDRRGDAQHRADTSDRETAPRSPPPVQDGSRQSSVRDTTLPRLHPGATSGSPPPPKSCEARRVKTWTASLRSRSCSAGTYDSHVGIALLPESAVQPQDPYALRTISQSGAAPRRPRTGQGVEVPPAPLGRPVPDRRAAGVSKSRTGTSKRDRRSSGSNSTAVPARRAGTAGRRVSRHDSAATSGTGYRIRRPRVSRTIHPPPDAPRPGTRSDRVVAVEHRNGNSRGLGAPPRGRPRPPSMIEIIAHSGTGVMLTEEAPIRHTLSEKRYRSNG